MAAISYVFTIRRAAQILGRDEELLWDLSDQLEPEDGKLWVLDIDGADPTRDVLAVPDEPDVGHPWVRGWAGHQKGLVLSTPPGPPSSAGIITLAPGAGANG